MGLALTLPRGPANSYSAIKTNLHGKQLFFAQWKQINVNRRQLQKSMNSWVIPWAFYSACTVEGFLTFAAYDPPMSLHAFLLICAGGSMHRCHLELLRQRDANRLTGELLFVENKYQAENSRLNSFVSSPQEEDYNYFAQMNARLVDDLLKEAYRVDMSEEGSKFIKEFPT